jgi:hypothetical protein
VLARRTLGQALVEVIGNPKEKLLHGRMISQRLYDIRSGRDSVLGQQCHALELLGQVLSIESSEEDLS